MADYTITMQRLPGLSDGEIRAKLSRVYAILLNIGRSKAQEAKTEQMEAVPDPTGKRGGDS
jgi:hypothetical protein